MRSRNIKPGFFENEKLSELEPLARILFAGLWCYADREGRFEWRPKRIKAVILPYDDVDITSILQALTSAGFIVSYSVNGDEYGFIPNFKKHQNPHPHEAKSQIPESIQCHDMSVTCSGTSAKCTADSLIPDSLIPDSNTPLNTPPKTKIEIPDWIPEETWKMFLSHRKAMKAPVGKGTEEVFFKKFRKLKDQGYDPPTVVGTMIDRGWKWFKPEWLKDGERNGSTRNPNGTQTQAGRREPENFAGKQYVGDDPDKIPWNQD